LPSTTGPKPLAGLPSLSCWTSTPLAVLAREMDYPVVNSLANPMLAHGARYQSGTANVTFPIDDDIVCAAADGFFEGLPYAKVREVAPGRYGLR